MYKVISVSILSTNPEHGKPDGAGEIVWRISKIIAMALSVTPGSEVKQKKGSPSKN